MSMKSDSFGHKNSVSSQIKDIVANMNSSEKTEAPSEKAVQSIFRPIENKLLLQMIG